MSRISTWRAKLELICREKGVAVLQRQGLLWIPNPAVFEEISVAELVSLLSQTVLQSVADWKLDKHQAVLRFNPSVVLADHRPNGILVNRQLTRGHLGIEHLKQRKKNWSSQHTMKICPHVSSGIHVCSELFGFLLCLNILFCMFFSLFALSTHL